MRGQTSGRELQGYIDELLGASAGLNGIVCLTVRVLTCRRISSGDAFSKCIVQSEAAYL